MTEIQIPYLPSAQFFKIRCRLGINEQDIIGDSDSNPQIRTIGGTVTIFSMVPRFRYTEADGRSRVVYTKTETYNIQTSTGELFDADGNIGVFLLNTNSPQMDPQGWTYRATVRPNGGEPFDVPIPSDPEGGVFDLGDGLVFTPSTGITTLETRVKALEDAQGGASGLPENFDESVQDIVGSMIAGAGGTYNDADGTVTLPSGGGGAVSSVAGRTGDVALKVEDLTDASSLATDTELTSGLAGKANLSHTHTSLSITDWAEAVQDTVAAMLTSGANVTLTYDDAAGKVTVTAAGGDAELMRDTIGAALAGVGGVSVAVNDAADTITLSISGVTSTQVSDSTAIGRSLLTAANAAAARTAIGAGTSNMDTEGVQDIVGSMIAGAGGTYNDAEGTVTLPSAGGGLVASFVVSGQREAVVSSFDAATDTFTSPAHGFVNGNTICAFSNNHEQIAIRQFLPGGMNTGGRWFVVSATANTFKISSTEGGAPVDLTVRGTEDLTRWHFEAVASSVAVITGLAPSRTYRLVAIGQVQGYANTFWHSLAINGLTTPKTTALTTGTGPEGYHEYLSADYRFDTRGPGMIRGGFVNVFQRAASADNAVTTRTFTETLQIGAAAQNVPITSLGFVSNTVSAYWANGSVMEVWL